MIVRGGGQGAGGTFLESLCPGPPQLPERALGGLTVSPSHISKTVPPAVQPRANMALLPVTPPPTRHTTGIERPRCVDRLPSHISKMVVSTVCGGWASVSRTASFPLGDLTMRSRSNRPGLASTSLRLVGGEGSFPRHRVRHTTSEPLLFGTECSVLHATASRSSALRAKSCILFPLRTSIARHSRRGQR